MALEQNELRTNLTANNKSFVKGLDEAGKSADRFSRRLSNKTSASRQGELALIELGRGLSDVRFGFHGAANNAQRMVEIFGQAVSASGSFKGALEAVGGAIFSTGGLVAGISILIAFGPEIYDFLKKNLASPASQARQEVKKLTGELEKLRESYFGGDSVESKILSKWDEIIAKQEDYVDKLINAPEATTITTGGSTVRSGQNVTQEDIDFANLQLTINKAGRDVDKRAFDDAKRKKDVLKAQNNAYKEQLERIREGVQLRTAAGEDENDILKWQKGQLEVIDENVVGAKNYAKVVHNIAVLSERIATNLREAGMETVKVTNAITGKNIIGLTEIYDSLGPSAGGNKKERTENFLKALGIPSPEEIDTGLKEVRDRLGHNLKDIGDDVGQINDLLSGIIAGGIADFASTLGEALVAPDDLGKKLLGAIGKLMVAFGTALIAWGVGWKFFKEAPKDPVSTIIAGAALVVAGAAISAVASKAANVGGGGSSSPAATVSTPDLRSIQGSGGRGRNVGGLSTRDGNVVLSPDIVRQILQTSDRTYGSTGG